jgi:hypothetical protein
MGIKSIALGASAVIFSSSVQAALISADWQTSGDNLITKDTVSHLSWLDLTETNNLSYNHVSGQLAAGGQFDGWRYASDAEVINLFINVGIDLSAGAPTSIVSAVLTAPLHLQEIVYYLGNIAHEFVPFAYDFGVAGLTSDTKPGLDKELYVNRLSAYNLVELYEWGTEPSGFQAFTKDWSYNGTGSYLVHDTQVVPVPAALWLFGSGLLGLVGVARRKVRA